MSEPVFHITSRKAWKVALADGHYAPESLSTEGFIHCSRPSQVLGVANAFYRGQRGLILLVIDPDLLVSELKWEPPAEIHPGSPVGADESFPHLYGILNLEAVVRTSELVPDAQGYFQSMPEL